jgi:hypothetical protein
MQKTASDLRVLAETGLTTTRYARFSPALGTPVRTSVGHPRGWRHGPMPHCRTATPYGVLDLAPDVQHGAYLERLDRHDDELLAELVEIAHHHPGPLVLLCYEDVHAGKACHRRWLADWFADRHGLAIPEVELALPVDAQGRLFG